MSYDLNFWKYKEGVYLDNQEVYEQCSDGQLVDGLEDLPIENIEKDITTEFSDWVKSGNSWQPADESAYFEIYTTKQFVRFDCYRMKGEDMNRIMDVMFRYDCPLYDPQVPKRFDGKE